MRRLRLELADGRRQLGRWYGGLAVADIDGGSHAEPRRGRQPLCRFRIIEAPQERGIDLDEIHASGFKVFKLRTAPGRKIIAVHGDDSAQTTRRWEFLGYA
jgi:hypothetical protein